jgi:hypothetical protein
MKFPFDFSLTLVFRLVFPGTVLAVAFWPIITTVLKMAGFIADLKLGIPIAAVVFGWLVVLGDQPLYMLYEGRLWWPKWLEKRGLASQTARLQAAIKRGDELFAAKDGSWIEYDLKKLDFPIKKETGEYFVKYPTRLGNIIEAFETYSNIAWGIDAIFYWPRLWLVLDKDTRGMLDELQAIADSAFYVSFALLVSVVLFLGYSIGGFLAFIPHWRRFDLPDLPAPWWTLLIAVCLALASYAVYWLALSQQRSYGELFKSLFDQFRDKLGFVDDAAAIAVTHGTPRQAVLDCKYTVAAMYLRWHRIRPAPGASTVTPEAWAKTKAQQPPKP